MSMHHSHKHLAERPWDFWLARGAVIMVASMQLLLINDFSVGPRWFAPAIEILLLIPLSVATAWTLTKARSGNGHVVVSLSHYRRWVRRFAVGLTAIITLLNSFALLNLVNALLHGRAQGGQTLLLDALNIWFTNIIAFSLWFWNMDRGGPALRGTGSHVREDFLFPQYQIEEERERGWTPGYIDYLFLAFTNATAFSPTDTLPLSPRAKLLMMAQSAVSLLVIALVAARAVNILA